MTDETVTDEAEAIRERKRERLQTRDTPTAEEGTNEAETASEDDPIYLDGEAEFQRVLASNELVLVDFYADWCGPCEMIEPTLETIAETTPATVAKVDVDANQALAQGHGVRGIPALLLVQDGDVVERLTGVQDESTLRSLIDQYAA